MTKEEVRLSIRSVEAEQLPSLEEKDRSPFLLFETKDLVGLEEKVSETNLEFGSEADLSNMASDTKTMSIDMVIGDKANME